MRHLMQMMILVIAVLGLAAPAYAVPDSGVQSADAPAVVAATVATATKAPPAKAGAADVTSAAKAPQVPAGEAPEPKAGPAVQSWWQALIYDVVFKLIMPIFTLVLSALVFWLLRKMGLKIELETLDKIALSAATYGEKKGAEWLRENGEKSGGARKERWAWELVEMVDSKVGGRAKAKNKLRGLILGKVAEAEKIVNGKPTLIAGKSAIRELVAEPKEG